jgi:hypothetical protein
MVSSYFGVWRKLLSVFEVNDIDAQSFGCATAELRMQLALAEPSFAESPRMATTPRTADSPTTAPRDDSPGDRRTRPLRGRERREL